MPFGSTFSRTFLTSHFTPEVDQRTQPGGAAHDRNVVVVAEGLAVAVVNGDSPELWCPVADAPGLVYLGECEDASVWALEKNAMELPTGVEMLPLRGVGPLLNSHEANLALTAVGMLAWHRDYRYCPQCGDLLSPYRNGWMLRCPHGHMQFPRTDPAVIVAITDHADRLLLAHNRRSATSMVSVLAGFVEPGEDLETAIVREVHEEVGLHVEHAEYRASQPWPYPRSLMIGYRARVRRGDSPDELRLQKEEITHARWWSRLEFREARADGSLTIPEAGSIGRALIDEWANSAPDMEEETC